MASRCSSRRWLEQSSSSTISRGYPRSRRHLRPVSAFIPTLRSAFLFLSQQKNLRHWMETSPVAQSLTSRFIAGLRLEDAVRVASDLQRSGILTSLDYLGENVTPFQRRRLRLATRISRRFELCTRCKEPYR